MLGSYNRVPYYTKKVEVDIGFLLSIMQVFLKMSSDKQHSSYLRMLVTDADSQASAALVNKDLWSLSLAICICNKLPGSFSCSLRFESLLH